MCSTRLSTSWTQAFLVGLYEACSSDFSSWTVCILRFNTMPDKTCTHKQAAAKFNKQSEKLNNSHSGEAAQTSHSQNLYMPAPGGKQNHDTSQSDQRQNISHLCPTPNATHHVCDIQDLPVHGVFVMTGCGGEPEFLKCLIHQFLYWKRC